MHQRLITGGLCVALLAAVLLGAATAHAATQAAGMSVVAQAKYRTVAVYRMPTSKKPFKTFSNPTADGGPLVFLVKQRAAGWEKVYLPVRPDGSTGWVKDSSVNLSLDPYRVVVSLSAHSVIVYEQNKQLYKMVAGVGRSALPTPLGTYYIVELLKQADPNGLYGPYAFGLSAFSNMLYSFGGGPGEIGLHGTNEPGLLGGNPSHGCIRISDANILKLARLLPLGTPVQITR